MTTALTGYPHTDIILGTSCEACGVVDDSVRLRAEELYLCADCVSPTCRECGQGMRAHSEDDRCRACHLRHYYAEELA